MYTILNSRKVLKFELFTTLKHVAITMRPSAHVVLCRSLLAAPGRLICTRLSQVYLDVVLRLLPAFTRDVKGHHRD